jgi:hypothetical protein
MIGKLAGLKEWLTLEDAASHLSLILEEPVEIKDLVQLALQDKLNLSVVLPSETVAVPYIDRAEGKIHQLEETQLIDGQSRTFSQGGVSKTEARQEHRLEHDPLNLLEKLRIFNHFLWGIVVHGKKLEPSFEDSRYASGCWAFPMNTGGNLRILEDLLQGAISDSPINRDVEDSFPHPVIIHDPKKDSYHALADISSFDREADRSFKPLSELPTSSSLCISQAQLTALMRSLNGEPETTPPDDRAETLPDDFRALYEALGAGELPHLDLLITAWRKFWKGRRPNDGKDYPINPEVADWVKSQMDNPEQGNSKAKAIASIIRPTWAPAGRQPNRNK